MLKMRVYVKWGSKTPMEDIFVNGEVTGKTRAREKKLTCIMYFYYTFLKNRAMGKL